MLRKESNGWKIDFSGEKTATPLLDTVNNPVHTKNLSTHVLPLLLVSRGSVCVVENGLLIEFVQDLEQLAAEVRVDTMHCVENWVAFEC